MKKKIFSGFTLIELMVVIAIIGLLSAIVISNLATAKSKSRDSRRISDISNIQLALANYLYKCGGYPTGNDLSGDATAGWSCQTTFDTHGSYDNLDKLVLLGLLPALPKDPINSDKYVYGYSSEDGTSYCLAANLENLNGAVDLTNTCTGSDLSPLLVSKWFLNWTAGDNPYIVKK